MAHPPAVRHRIFYLPLTCGPLAPRGLTPPTSRNRARHATVTPRATTTALPRHHRAAGSPPPPPPHQQPPRHLRPASIRAPPRARPRRPPSRRNDTPPSAPPRRHAGRHDDTAPQLPRQNSGTHPPPPKLTYAAPPARHLLDEMQ